MLNKLNDIYSKVIFENSQDKWIRKITTDTEFYNTYFKPLILKLNNNIDIVKARLNTFRISGLFKNVKTALEDLKIDELYWDESVMGGPFKLYTPMITFGEVVHVLNNSEGFPVGTVADNSLYALINQNRISFDGKWHEPKLLDYKKYGFDFPVRAKSATPLQLIKMIENLIESEYKNPETTFVVVEFMLNCENRINQVFDETSEFVPIIQSSDEEDALAETDILVDKINDLDEKTLKPITKCELPKENTENKVKVPSVDNSGKISLKKAYINTYDPKNKFKKTVKEVK